jgi:peroxiredoxin Q/BCP
VFVEAGAQVIGVSSQSVESHNKFAVFYKLPFILLSDVGDKVRQLYGVPSTLGVFAGRVTYVIDKKGIVRHILVSQFSPKKHVEEALRIIEDIGKE